MTLTRATLGNLTKRKTVDIEILGHKVRLQKPSPLEYSQYVTGMGNAKGEPDLRLFPEAILLLTSRMWIDDDGKRIFADNETKDLANIDLEFYEKLSAECQNFAKPGASTALGESDKTTVLDSPAESVSS